MKKVIVYPLLIAFALVMSCPVISLAQNDKPGKKVKTETPTKTKKVVTPAPPAAPDAPLPPGQVGKTDPNEKVQGYEKTGDKGKKEGWDKDRATADDKKSVDKEVKKAEKKRNKELRKAEKLRIKAEKKAGKTKSQKN